jgi:hypothetical protein
MVIFFRVARLVASHLLAQILRKPWVVPIIDFDADEIGIVRVLAKQRVDRVGVEVGVPRKPLDRARLAERRDGQFERPLGQRLRFLVPRAVEPFERLDRRRRVVLQAAKNHQAIGRRASDLAFGDLEFAPDAVKVDFVLDELLDRILD